MLGTPGYMAPEQARGELDQVDERADVFGLGAILCEILTGEPAFVGRSTAETLRKAGRGELAEAFARLEGCGADLELIALAKDCLAAEREDRPRRAGAVVERITAYLAGVQERLRKAELERVEANARAEEERKRRKLGLGLAAAVVALVVLGGGGATMYLQQRQAQTGRLELALRDVHLLIRQADDSEGDPAKWHSARDAVKRAEDLLGPLIDAKSQRQVRELAQQVAEKADASERDARLLRELIDIRSTPGDQQDPLASDAAYGRAFRDAGIEVDVLEPEAAASKIRARPAAVALALSAALDEWVTQRRSAHPKDVGGWKRLLATVRAADPDPTRDRLRQLSLEPDPKAQRHALIELARGVDPKDWPPASLTLLADLLTRAGEHEAAADFLRRAQLAHPGDVWVNYDLGNVLSSLRPPRLEEAIQYLGVARASQTGDGGRSGVCTRNGGPSMLRQS